MPTKFKKRWTKKTEFVMESVRGECTDPVITEVTLRFEYIHKNGETLMGKPKDVRYTVFEKIEI